jgi:putative ABC transport system permease protein
VTTVLNDARLAFRSLIRRPLFTGIVLLTLALGIGANTAIFSVVDSVLLRPLPYREPGSIALIWSKWSNFDKTWLSTREYFEYQRHGDLFAGVGAWDDIGTVALTGDGSPESVEAVNVTHNVFDVLGATPERGRWITAAEDVPNGPRVAVVGYGLWQRRYGGDPGLVGRTIQVDGASYTVVGILPRSFRLPLEFQRRTRAELFTSLGLDPGNVGDSHGMFGVARLQPGVTVARVTRELQTIAARWTSEGVWPVTAQFSAFAVGLADEVNGGVRTVLLVLLGAVALLLGLSASNVANLLLTRADSREREMAVRTALGASRARMLQTSLTESLVLSLGGGALGLLFAWGGVRLLGAVAPTSIPRADELGVNPTVLAFTLVLSLLTGFVFGAIPALRATRVNLAGSLREGGRSGSEGKGRLRGRALLVVAEMAIAVTLVIGAGLLVRSFRNLTQVNPGFDAHNVLTMRMSLPPARYAGNPELVRFYDELAGDVRRMPGVQAAGFVRVLPLAEEIGDAGIAIEGRPVDQAQPNLSADWQVATPGYFQAMRIHLVRGRFFDATDRTDGPQVIIINETFASQYFPNEDPIGKRIRTGRPDGPWREIVGIVADTRHDGLMRAPKRQYFAPHTQFAASFGNTSRAMTLVVRSAGDPRSLITAVEAVIRAKDPALPVTNVATLDDVLASAVREQRFATTLMAGFALLAMTLAAVGIYGVISYSVSQRTREIGVRLALGANAGSVRRLVIAQGMLPAVIGVAVGVFGAAGLTRFVTRLLFGVGALDVTTFVAIPAFLLLLALLATLVPAVRATRVDPMQALRYE